MQSAPQAPPMVEPRDLWRDTPGRSRHGGSVRPRHRPTPLPPTPPAAPTEWRAPAADPAAADGGLFGAPRNHPAAGPTAADGGLFGAPHNHPAAGPTAADGGLFGAPHNHPAAGPSAADGGLFGAPHHAPAAGLFNGRGPPRVDLLPPPPPSGAFTRRTYEGGTNINILRYVPHEIYRRRDGEPRDPHVGDLGAFPVLAPAHSTLAHESLQAKSLSTYDPLEDEIAADARFERMPVFFENADDDDDAGGPPAPAAGAPDTSTARAVAHGAGADSAEHRGSPAAQQAHPLHDLFTSGSFRKHAVQLSRSVCSVRPLGALLSAAVSIAVAVLWGARLPVFHAAPE
eukprot:jgi/Ulvmu1/5515/UM023_0051.1